MITVLLIIVIYCSINYIEALVFDAINKDNDHQGLRFTLSLLVSALIGLIYYLNI
jgi:hypothetical protein